MANDACLYFPLLSVEPKDKRQPHVKVGGKVPMFSKVVRDASHGFHRMVAPMAMVSDFYVCNRKLKVD